MTMKFGTRTFLPMNVKGRRNTYLSTYIQVQEKDLEWINGNKQDIILSELRRLITESLSEIEKLNEKRIVNKESCPFVRVGGSSEIVLSFMLKHGRGGELIELKNSFHTETNTHPNFHLIIWLFKAEIVEKGNLLPIEEI